jgi:hypothetical protein
MNNESTARKRAEVVDEVSKWTVGAGILTVALAPLALPILALTAVAVLPILLPVLAIGLIAGVVYLPITLIRRLSSRSRARHRKPPRAAGGRQTPVVGNQHVSLNP